MGSEEHECCPQHSGVESRQSTILWLLGVLISINLLSAGYQFVALGQVRDKVAEGATGFAKGDAEDRALREKITSLEQRLLDIERSMK
jgi:hypothetical protein